MSQTTLRILLVEDEADHAELVCRAFAPHPETSLTVAGSLRKARAAIAATRPDVVIVDLLLPDGKGTELLPADRTSVEFPVVVMTGYGNEEAAVEAMKAGAFDYLVKSAMALADMPRTVERVLRDWQHVVERRRAEEALRQAHRELERRVQERTAELATANERLRQEVEERRQIEEDIRREHETLRRLMESSDRERRLIAYEIHDGLAQQLAGAVLHFQNFDRLRCEQPDEAVRSLDVVKELIDQSLSEVRRLISGLRPPLLEELGVVAALESLTAACGQGPPRVELVENVGPKRFAPLLENSVFRIVQEALTNARRYGKSDKVRVELAGQEDDLRIEIRDWGVGFDPEKVATSSYGLQGIRERARLLGGEAAIESKPGEGTRIVVTLPLAV
jgi:signal transduction histidine kinase